MKILQFILSHLIDALVAFIVFVLDFFTQMFINICAMGVVIYNLFGGSFFPELFAWVYGCTLAIMCIEIFVICYGVDKFKRFFRRFL